MRIANTAYPYKMIAKNTMDWVIYKGVQPTTAHLIDIGEIKKR